MNSTLGSVVPLAMFLSTPGGSSSLLLQVTHVSSCEIWIATVKDFIHYDVRQDRLTDNRTGIGSEPANIIEQYSKVKTGKGTGLEGTGSSPDSLEL